MSIEQKHPGVPAWVHERHPGQLDLIVSSAAKAVRLFEDAMMDAMHQAGGPDEVEEAAVDGAAHEAFDGAFSASHGIGMPGNDWDALEETFCEQMKARFEGSMAMAWHASTAPRP